MKFIAIVAFAMFASSAFAGDCCSAKKAVKADPSCAAPALKAATSVKDASTTKTASAGKKA